MQSGKRRPVNSFVERQKLVRLFNRVSADQKVRKNTPRPSGALRFSSIGICLKRVSGGNPDFPCYFPIDRDSGIRAKFFQERPVPARASQKLREN